MYVIQCFTDHGDIYNHNMVLTRKRKGIRIKNVDKFSIEVRKAKKARTTFANKKYNFCQ